jgi:hypothetical protein
MLYESFPDDSTYVQKSACTLNDGTDQNPPKSNSWEQRGSTDNLVSSSLKEKLKLHSKRKK